MSKEKGSGEREKVLTRKVLFTLIFAYLVLQPLVLYYYLLSNIYYAFSFYLVILLFSEVSSVMRVDFTVKELFVLLALQSVIFSYSTMGINFFRYMYFAYSEPSKMFEIDKQIPSWFVPPEPIVRALYSEKWPLLHPAFFTPIAVTLIFSLLAVLVDISLGYLSYAIFVVEEKLEFPFARASVALVESLASREPATLRVIFSSILIGVILNLALKFLPYIFSAFALGGVILLGTPGYAFDFTQYLDYILPGAGFLWITDPLSYVSGLLIPPAVAITQFITAFILYFVGTHLITRFDLWPPESKWATGWGYGTLYFRANLYFYVSLIIGISLALLIVSLAANPRILYRSVRVLSSAEKLQGSIPIKWLLSMFIVSTVFMSLFAWYLTSYRFPLYILLLLIGGGSFLASYVATAAAGVTVFGTSVPYLRELTIYLSGYREKDVWFIPLPATLSSAPLGTAVTMAVSPLGGAALAQVLLQAQVLGVRHTEVIKTYLILIIGGIVTSLVLASLLWYIAPMPSSAYPYTVTGWQVDAVNWARMMVWIWTGYIFRREWILTGFIAGTVLYLVSTKIFAMPFLLPAILTGASIGIPWAFSQMIGSIIGRKVMRSFLGEKAAAYTYLLVMGVLLGDSLMETVRILIVILARSQWLLPF
jgi:hypothetical protein